MESANDNIISGQPIDGAIDGKASSSADARLTFPKSERLRHKILVDSLFAKGKSVYEYPFRVVCRTLTDAELAEAFSIGIPDRIAPLQVLITIPKKKRRHAVDRVLMRRRIRDIWRRHRRPLRAAIESTPELRTMSVAIIYMSNENIPSATLERKLTRLIGKLIARVEGESAPDPV